ncbi:uncharacterized protein LOC124255976 [Haliotis rubra]|uniref:uncharacterized protein LOC124255976 n=1 Tax=Haliotis rubra TaxID=36100 RepID=UPI001EE5886D|nr:uncharacterized protein LOC124255976 [Haliotis rubra]
MFRDDFSFLKLCLDFLNQEVENIDDVNDYDNRCMRGYFSHLQNGCEAKLILPQGVRPVQQLREEARSGGNVLYFVGFIGNRWKDVGESSLKDLWEMDDCLLGQLRNHEDIVAVSSGERTPGVTGETWSFSATLRRWRNGAMPSFTIKQSETFPHKSTHL